MPESKLQREAAADKVTPTTAKPSGFLGLPAHGTLVR